MLQALELQGIPARYQQPLSCVTTPPCTATSTAQEGRGRPAEAALQDLQGRQVRSAELRQARLQGIVRAAADESRKVEEIAFINQLRGGFDAEERKLQLQLRLDEGAAQSIVALLPSH